MAQAGIRADPRRFVNYYESQAGRALPGFYGAPVMYGQGIGSIFSRLFHFVSLLLKKGFAIPKPHLKSATANTLKFSQHSKRGEFFGTSSEALSFLCLFYPFVLFSITSTSSMQTHCKDLLFFNNHA